jgi:hypothetical protein
MNLDVIRTISGFFFGSTILKRAYQQFHVREKSLLPSEHGNSHRFSTEKVLLPFPILPLFEPKQENLLSTTSSWPIDSFSLPQCRAALSVCCSFYCVLERFGFNKHLPFPSLCFSSNTHTRNLPTTSQFTRKHERMGSDDPCGVLCACVYRLFFSKKKVVHFSASYGNLSVLVGFFTEIIYHPPREIGGVKLASHGWRERKTTLS